MRRQFSGVVKYCLPCELLAGEHVPQPELGLEPSVGLARDAAGDERLRVDGAPVGEARHRVEIGDLLDEGGRVDRREQTGALQVGADDLGDLRAPSRYRRACRRGNPAARSASAATLPWVMSRWTTACERGAPSHHAHRGRAGAENERAPPRQMHEWGRVLVVHRRTSQRNSGCISRRTSRVDRS